MAKPPRDRSLTSTSTYFITANAFEGQALFQSERVANLLAQSLLEYRQQGRFLLHEFVIMPNHLHVLLTIGNAVTLERAVQFIKGGFSHRAGKQLEMKGEIWQRGADMWITGFATRETLLTIANTSAKIPSRHTWLNLPRITLAVLPFRASDSMRHLRG